MTAAGFIDNRYVGLIWDQARDRPGAPGSGPVLWVGFRLKRAGVAQVWLDDVKVWEELFGRSGRGVEVDDRAVDGAPMGRCGEGAGLVEM